uniref:Protein kinase domain-containing protein n=1 Tax=Anguilla anguilla TaxID=7936 RepID=A0A0E9SV67_ANGAN
MCMFSLFKELKHDNIVGLLDFQVCLLYIYMCTISSLWT